MYLLGSQPGVAERAGDRLAHELGVTVVGTDSPLIDVDGSLDAELGTIDRLRAARPDLVFVALGAPKQELWIDRYSTRITPAVAIGVGGASTSSPVVSGARRGGCHASDWNGCFVLHKNPDACGGATSSTIRSSSRSWLAAGAAPGDGPRLGRAGDRTPAPRTCEYAFDGHLWRH